MPMKYEARLVIFLLIWMVLVGTSYSIRASSASEHLVLLSPVGQKCSFVMLIPSPFGCPLPNGSGHLGFLLLANLKAWMHRINSDERSRLLHKSRPQAMVYAQLDSCPL